MGTPAHLLLRSPLQEGGGYPRQTLLRPAHLSLLRPLGSFKRRGLAANRGPGKRLGLYSRGGERVRALSAAATAAPRAWATMSGRVGDLSPRQKEALAKVSPHPVPARPRPGRWPPSSGGSGLGRGWMGGERGSAASGGRSGSHRTERSAVAPSLAPLHPPRGPRGSLVVPAPAASEPLALPPGKKWLLGSPRRQLRAQRQSSFSGLAAGPWGQGQGQGPRFPPISGRFSSCRGSGTMERAGGLLRRLGWLLLWHQVSLRPWAKPVLLCSLLEERN